MNSFLKNKNFWQIIRAKTPRFLKTFFGFKTSGVRHFVKGQGLVEYALLLLFVAIAVIAVLTIMGPQVGSLYSPINKGLS